MVFVTHDLAEAALLADRILFLSPGPARVLGEATVGIPRRQRGDDTIVTRRYQELKKLFNSLY